MTFEVEIELIAVLDMDGNDTLTTSVFWVWLYYNN